jgi:hypothetical protein
MSKCEFVYETDPLDTRLTGGMGGLVTLRCKTHDCTMMIHVPSGELATCLVGLLEQLDARITQLERPQRSTEIDELGNPYSLRIPVKDE